MEEQSDRTQPRFRRGLNPLAMIAMAVAYGFCVYLVIEGFNDLVSIAFALVLPMVVGMIPAMFLPKNKLTLSTLFLAFPIVAAVTLLVGLFVGGLEGAACLLILAIPFLVLASVGAFIVRAWRRKADRSERHLPSLLLLPFLCLVVEMSIAPDDSFNTITTTMNVQAPRSVIWEQIKNVRNIQPEELEFHFVHLARLPKPLNGELDHEGVGGVRHITWERGVEFEEVITSWQEGVGFDYGINIDPATIPEKTLDDHVKIGGEHFDVLNGGYHIDSLGPNSSRVTLYCRYRVTTTFNFYTRWWGDFIVDDFNQMILEVVKKRAERGWMDRVR